MYVCTTLIFIASVVVFFLLYSLVLSTIYIYTTIYPVCLCNFNRTARLPARSFWVKIVNMCEACLPTPRNSWSRLNGPQGWANKYNLRVVLLPTTTSNVQLLLRTTWKWRELKLLLQLRKTQRIKTIKTFWVFGFSGLQAAQVQPHKHIHIQCMFVYSSYIYLYIYSVPVYMRYNCKMYI